MVEGVYRDCFVKVTDAEGNTSDGDGTGFDKGETTTTPGTITKTEETKVAEIIYKAITVKKKASKS